MSKDIQDWPAEPFYARCQRARALLNVHDFLTSAENLRIDGKIAKAKRAADLAECSANGASDAK